MPDETESVSFDLEERLKDDKDGHRKAAILDELSAVQQSLKRSLDAGAAPAEYEKLKRMQAAVDAAQHTIEAAAKHLSKRA